MNVIHSKEVCASVFIRFSLLLLAVSIFASVRLSRLGQRPMYDCPAQPFLDSTFQWIASSLHHRITTSLLRNALCQIQDHSTTQLRLRFRVQVQLQLPLPLQLAARPLGRSASRPIAPSPQTPSIAQKSPRPEHSHPSQPSSLQPPCLLRKTLLYTDRYTRLHP